MFKSIILKLARRVMRKALEDPELHEGYRANIAMCIYDNRRKDGRLNIRNCNEVAGKLIKVIFE